VCIYINIHTHIYTHIYIYIYIYLYICLFIYISFYFFAASRPAPTGKGLTRYDDMVVHAILSCLSTGARRVTASSDISAAPLRYLDCSPPISRLLPAGISAAPLRISAIRLRYLDCSPPVALASRRSGRASTAPVLDARPSAPVCLCVLLDATVTCLYARRMGQPTQTATNYTARSNIVTAQIFSTPTANGQSAPWNRQRSRRRQARGATHRARPRRRSMKRDRRKSL